MSRLQVGLIVFVAFLIIIQFVQPERNTSVRASTSGIAAAMKVPENVHGILLTSCYDCHSNNTRYPWYASLQPGAWWMASHIKEGKAELNFDEFANYSSRRKLSKLRAIRGAIEEGSMPLPSYILMHKDARLTPIDQKILKDWIKISLDKMSN